MRENRLRTRFNITIPSTTFWSKFHRLTICPNNFFYYEGNCTNQNSYLLNDPTSAPNEIKTEAEPGTIQFTIDFWYLHPANNLNWLITLGNNNRVEIFFNTNTNIYLRMNVPSNYDLSVNTHTGWWTFVRFALNNETNTNKFRSEIYIYYPRTVKTSTGRSDIPTYERIRGPLRLFRNDYQSRMAHLTVWNKYISSDHNSPPLNAFYHPEYADPELFGYYPFHSSLIDESGKGHHFIAPNEALSPEFKYAGWYGYGQGYEQPGWNWTQGVSHPTTYTFSGGEFDGCIFKYKFDHRIFIRSEDFKIHTCNDIISNAGTLSLLGNEGYCHFFGTSIYISMSYIGMKSLSGSINVDLDPAKFYNSLSGGTMRATYAAQPSPYFLIIDHANSLNFNRLTSRNISLSSHNVGTLNPIFSWKLSLLDNSILDLGTQTTILEITPETFNQSGNYLLNISMSFKEAPNYIYTEELNINAFIPCKAVLSGGDKTVKKGESIKLSGRESKDMDIGEEFSEFLEFKWLCSVDNISFSSSCSGIPALSNTVDIEISTTSLTAGAIYYFRLIVTKNEISDQRTGRIEIIADGLSFGIKDSNSNPKYSASVDNRFSLQFNNYLYNYKTSNVTITWSISPKAEFREKGSNMLIPAFELHTDSKYILSVSVSGT